MAQNGDFGLMNADEGEQDSTHFILLPPHENAFFTELSSQFSNNDKKFEHLFECLNQKNITEKHPNSASSLSSELNVLYHQISDCLKQRPAKKTQIYFELKHHFELLHILRNENYTGEAFTLISKRAMDIFAASKTSWNFVKKSTVSGDLHDLCYCVDLPQSFLLSVTPLLMRFKTRNAWFNYQMKITTV